MTEGEWRSRPPERADGLARTWYGNVIRGAAGTGFQLEFCHNGSHRSAEAALACSRRAVRRLNLLQQRVRADGGAR